MPRHGRPAGDAPVDGRAHCHPAVFGGRGGRKRLPGWEARCGDDRRQLVLSMVHRKPRPTARLLRAGHALERLCRDRRRRTNVCAVDGQASESRGDDGSAEHGERAGALRHIQPRRRFARAPGKRRRVAQRRVHRGAPRGLRGRGSAGTTALGTAAVLQSGADDGRPASAPAMPQRGAVSSGGHHDVGGLLCSLAVFQRQRHPSEYCHCTAQDAVSDQPRLHVRRRANRSECVCDRAGRERRNVRPLCDQ